MCLWKQIPPFLPWKGDVQNRLQDVCVFYFSPTVYPKGERGGGTGEASWTPHCADF